MKGFKQAKSKAHILLYAFAGLIAIIVISLIILGTERPPEEPVPLPPDVTEVPPEEISWQSVPFNNYRTISSAEIEGNGVLLKGNSFADLEVEAGTYNLSYWISLCPDFALEYTRTYQDQSITYNPLRERVVIEDGVLTTQRKRLAEYLEAVREERIYILEVLDGEDTLLSKPIAETGSNVFETDESILRFKFRPRCSDANVLLRLHKQE